MHPSAVCCESLHGNEGRVAARAWSSKSTTSAVSGKKEQSSYIHHLHSTRMNVLTPCLESCSKRLSRHAHSWQLFVPTECIHTYPPILERSRTKDYIYKPACWHHASCTMDKDQEMSLNTANKSCIGRVFSPFEQIISTAARRLQLFSADWRTNRHDSAADADSWIFKLTFLYGICLVKSRVAVLLKTNFWN